MKAQPAGVFSAIQSRIFRRLLMTLLSASVTCGVFAADPISSSEASPEDYEDNWWRGVRKGMWEWEGANWTVVKSALINIEKATGKRRYEDKFDTIIEYGPGHWVYEWNSIGEKAYREALVHEKRGDEAAARSSFLEASTYYTQASYPHMRDRPSRDAVARAFDMYARAGRYFSVPMEQWEMEVDGARFKAFVHFPANHASGPMPVVLKTGGMDVLSTEFYPLSETINTSGAAMIVYDSPGTGNLGVVGADYDKHHVAVLKRVLKDKRFDAKRIGVWSESLAGLTAVRIALGDYREHVAAAVNSCGPMHSLYALESEAGPPTPYDSHELVESYTRGVLSEEKIAEINEIMFTSAFQARLLNFQTETFIDRVRATPENMLGLLAKSLPISLIDQGLLGEKNMTNTPILTINTFADPLVPPFESQMVTDASVQGRLMIYTEYGGHCVSRAEVPVIMEWLAYHLKLETLGSLVSKNRAK
jgi:esterase FrsA